jgi:transcriptional regulator with XRE-family HTH domain
MPKKLNPTQERLAWIKSRMKDFGLNVSKICAASGVSRATWRKWELAITEPNPRMWRKLTAALPPKLRKGMG